MPMMMASAGARRGEHPGLREGPAERHRIPGNLRAAAQVQTARGRRRATGKLNKLAAEKSDRVVGYTS